MPMEHHKLYHIDQPVAQRQSGPGFLVLKVFLRRRVGSRHAQLLPLMGLIGGDGESVKLDVLDG